MLRMFRYEVRRAVSSRAFALALTATTAISVLQFLTSGFAYGFLPIWENWRSGAGGITPPSVLNSWLGGTLSSVFSQLFYISAPLFACLPFSWSLGDDLSTGFTAVVMQRGDGPSYLRAKAGACFCAAAAVIMAPQLLNLLLTALCVPFIEPDPASGMYPVFARSAFAELFYRAPMAYVALYLLLSGIVMGSIGVLVMAASAALRSRAVLTVLPVVADELLYFLLFCASLGGYAPSRAIMPAQPFVGMSGAAVVLETAALTCLASVAVLRLSRRFEVL